MPQADLLRLYTKKSVSVDLRDVEELNLSVSQSLFSSHQVDTGTVHLLKSLRSELADPYHKTLDLGCGYGPIGLTMAKRYPTGTVHMVDRDALAVAFASENAKRNQLDNVQAYGSLGYEGVEAQDFDLVAANIPGKAGEDVIEEMLRGSQRVLRPDGQVAIVVVSPLIPLVTHLLEEPHVRLLDRVDKSAHSVFRYQFVSAPIENDLEEDLYRRETMSFEIDDLTYGAKTARGLPEFDTLSYRSVLVGKVLLDLDVTTPKRMLVLNPGQGHTAVAALLTQEPYAITLAGRDLLALRYSRLNLEGNGCAPSQLQSFHRIGLPDQSPKAEPYDLVLIDLRDDESPDVHAYLVKSAADVTQPGGTLLVYGGSTPVTRMLKAIQSDKRLLSTRRKKRKGESLAILERR
jgi:16S rRNA (guanine1207-N2)-methyltransferase